MSHRESRLTAVPLQTIVNRRTLLQTAAGTVVLAAALAPAASAALAQATGGTVTIIVPANPASWDMTTTTWPTFQGVTFMYDKLFNLDADENVTPALATEYTISDDGLTYELTLRDDVTFHDGTPFNAEAARFNIQRFLDQPDSASYVAFEPIETMEVVDDTHLTITLSEVRPGFLYEALSGWGSSMLSPEAYGEDGADFATNPVGTGPFRFASYEPGSEIRYVRNDEYWGGAPLLDGVIVRVVPEPAVTLIEMESGNADIAAIEPKDITAMEEAGLTVEQIIAPGAQMVSMNVSTFPTSELAVRQAIARAVDRDAMIESLLFGAAEKSRAGVNSASLFYSEDVPTVDYDPDEAARILDEAGWILGDDGVRARDGEPLFVSIISTDFSNWGLMNQVIQEQLTAIGIASEITSLEWNALLDQWRENQGNWNVSYHSQGSQVARIAAIQASWQPEVYWSITQIDDATAEDLVAVAARLTELDEAFKAELDEARQKELAIEIQTIFQENQLTAWLWHAATVTAFSPRVGDYTGSYAGRVINLNEATVSE